jgi:MFS-type transporter involved in bile tolerance (Atg22 family)
VLLSCEAGLGRTDGFGFVRLCVKLRHLIDEMLGKRPDRRIVEYRRAFWICGLLLCLFVGPTLASAWALMLRMSAEGKEGVAFGLYTTAGRAASFLAPLMFFWR